MLVSCSAVCNLIGSDTHNKARPVSQKNCEAQHLKNSIIETFGAHTSKEIKAENRERQTEEEDTNKKII